jgi:hypothetical protein
MNNGENGVFQITVSFPVGYMAVEVRTAYLHITAQTTVRDLIDAIVDLDTNISAKWTSVFIRPRLNGIEQGSLYEGDTIAHVIGPGPNKSTVVSLYG